jgi:peroxidase
VGQARCLVFRGRVYTDTNINATFARQRQQTCPRSGGDGNLAPFDDQTPDAFDNAYYRNLVAQRGLLHSDQELFNGGPQDALVRKYSGNGRMFANDFAKAMIKMGALAPAPGTPTEVRLNCRKVNSEWVPFPQPCCSWAKAPSLVGSVSLSFLWDYEWVR